MSKRTKLKVRNFRMFLAREIFNGRYIVRNILAVTLLMTVVTMTVGITMIVGGNKAEEKPVKKELANNYTIEVTESQQMEAESISILMADLDADSQANVEANTSQLVAESNIVKGTVLDNGVYVRAEASYMGEVVATADLDDIYNVDTLKSSDEWICVVFEDGSFGYVNSMFISVEDVVEADETTEADVEEATEAVIEDEDIEATGSIVEAGSITGSNLAYKNETTEAVTEESTEDTEEATTEETTTEDAATETEDTDTETEETTSETEDTTEREDTPVDGGVAIEVTYREAIVLTDEDINLMASIVTLECGGESYDGQLAVANVIINRMQTGHWGSTVSDVVYAPYQFSCATSPMLDYYIENGAQASCVEAVKEALSGVNNIGSYLCFRATSITDVSNYDVYSVIGNHVFH